MAPGAPRDPRLDHDLPAVGALPVVARLDEVTTRVVAPNPSPMTLDGTCTYVLAAPGSGEAIVVDPGPNDPSHRARVDAVLADLDAACVLVAVTHRHLDHAEAAAPWAAAHGARLAAPDPATAGAGGRVVHDGDVLTAGGLDLRAVATPGHTSDHTAYRSPTGALLVGDHVLGRGTSVVAHPDGDLEAYLASLRTVLDLGPHALLPGHGPALTEDPMAVVRFYLAHRAHREQQVLDVLAAGPATPRQVVEVVYAAVDPRLWDAAEASTRAALDKLVSDGRVEPRGERFALAS
jgi:glyoxylase-like metal-dependent hydrolase (beta-lactamase superfamily II)